MGNKNVLVINGATRVKGNTDIMLNRLRSSALPAQVKVQQIDLRKKNIKDCIGCFQCSDHTKCSLKDDMVEVYRQINRSGLIIFASPVYWWGVTGIMKILIDRLYFYYSDLNNPFIKGKKTMVLAPMNMSSDNYKTKIFQEFFQIVFDNLNMDLMDTHLFGNINEKGEIENNPKYLDQIDQLGKTLAKRLL